MSHDHRLDLHLKRLRRTIVNTRSVMLFVGLEIRLSLEECDDEELQVEWGSVIEELNKLASAAKKAVADSEGSVAGSRAGTLIN